MVFTLSWTVRAERAPWVRCSVRDLADSNLTLILTSLDPDGRSWRPDNPADAAGWPESRELWDSKASVARRVTASLGWRAACSAVRRRCGIREGQSPHPLANCARRVGHPRRDPREPFPNLRSPSPVSWDGGRLLRIWGSTRRGLRGRFSVGPMGAAQSVMGSLQMAHSFGV